GKSRCDRAVLRRRRPDRWQTRPTRRAADRFHREETGGRILCFVWTGCWRSCSDSCGGGAQGLVGQADWRGLATVVTCDKREAFAQGSAGDDCYGPELDRARLT